MSSEDEIMDKKKKLLIFAAAAVALNIVMNLLGNHLETEYYTVSSAKVDKPVRIAFISDLHNCKYGGKDNSKLWEAVQEAEPDIVIFGGDVIDFHGGTTTALRLMGKASEKYPCTYSPGNHEYMRDNYERFFSAVRSAGGKASIGVTEGSSDDTIANGQAVRVCGVSDAEGRPDKLENCYISLDKPFRYETERPETYNILLLHQPEQLDTVTKERANYDKGFDLVLSGHAHGGQWRIPKLLEQGLYAPDQGIFPDFTNGERSYGGTVQIVSRGLAKPPRMIFIPRIFNRPELLVIDIVPAEQ